MLIIGTTNYLERIDPALSKRPSRFDRKLYVTIISSTTCTLISHRLFDNPGAKERLLYCKYWQHKLEANKDISYPDDLVQQIADATHEFSFAFLKEIFVNTLVQIATGTEKAPFGEAVMRTVKNLRKEIDSGDGEDKEVADANVALASPGLARSFQTHFKRLMEP